jgi:hypothetical protein
MTRPFMVIPLLVLAAATGCGARPAFPQLQPAPAEAAGQAANPAGAGSVMTIQWDSAREGLRVEAVDAGSGAPAPGWEPLFLGEGGKEVGGYAYSPGGDRLAVLSGTTPFCTRSAGGSACWPGTDTLHVVDLQSGEIHALAFDPVAHVPLVAFSPDAQSVAFASETCQGYQISVWRIGDAEPGASTAVAFLPTLLEYSLNGRELIALGSDPGEDPGLTTPGPLTVSVFNVATLTPLWQVPLQIRHGGWCLEGCGDSHEQMLFANWTPAILRLPATDRIVIVHADSDRLTTIDADQRSVDSRPITDARTWLDRWMAWGTVPAEAKGGSEGVYRQAVASPDGKSLYLVGREFHAWYDADGMLQMSDEALGLQVIDPVTAIRQPRLGTNADLVALSPEGDLALLRSWLPSGAQTEVVLTDTLARGQTVEDWDVLAGRTLEGAPILLATSLSTSAVRMTLVDPTTLDIGEPWAVGPNVVLLFPQ